ncbi:hypothetical protein BN8_04673 [Fibrisoma limi BUZ 3]|uniref:Uncharacterized protein n=1 Tax=Fibrisoma limi BUZ 3 TaxID=1185876 RepID=I2GND8_9BACT|nr:hypothetical protein [Fibrisoma limi]CCH55416.1 hypothetical protein BN8_04673 [Fibrisoma limi BUZ 3]
MNTWIRMYAPGDDGGSAPDGAEDKERDDALESGDPGNEADAALGGLTDGGDGTIETSGAMGLTSEDYEKTA